MSYLLLGLIVFVVNLLPAFGPPTWAILVFTRLHWHLHPVAIVVIGGVAAMSGRYLLARGARHFKTRLTGRLKSNLADATELLERRRGAAIGIVALFVVSPLPSAQLFVGAGLLSLPLELLTIAFFIGRIVSYSIYVSAATLADTQLSQILRQSFGSFWSIALQLLFLIAVGALPFVRWKRPGHRQHASP